ncbi:MAG TPA: tetratricopeptide repeat protein [Xanthomonadales bacterium]|nr:tetratricopeptide repeat protein [Xanthomonadales bacterium]
MDFNAILAQLRNGHAREARAALDAARAAGDDSAPVNGLLARACLALGDRAGARAALEAGLARDRSFGPLWLERAMLARLEGDAAVLVASLAEAHRLMPQQPGVSIDLANALAATGRYAEADAVLAPLVSAQPNLAPAWLARGKVAFAAGDAAAAHDCFANAHRLAPSDTVALEGLAESADALGRYQGALWARERLAQLAPDDVAAQLALADVQRRQDRNEEARSAFTRAIALGSRDPLVRWLRWQSLPLVPKSAAHAVELADEWDAGLADWERWIAESPPGVESAAALLASAGSFFRHYLDGDVAALQRRYGALLGRLAAIAFAHVRPAARRNGSRRRIAFASSHFRRHTVANYFGAWLARLDRERFEVHAVHLDPEPDATTAALRASVDGWHEASGLREAIDDVAALGFDAIVHLDVGMHPLGQAMAATRLAPFQAVAWGHPVTTGLASIDAFLSSEWMEPADAASDYSERLVRLPRLGACIARPVAAPDRSAAARAGLARPYFFCPQSVSKLTPVHDALFARIAAACPGHDIVVVPSQYPHVCEQLGARMALAFRAAGVDPARLRFVAMQPHAGFLGLVHGAAALLDTCGFSGGNTSLDAIAVGTPIVTLPGATMRARQTAAMLRGIGVADGVVADEAGYVAQALAFADGAVRRDAASRIAAAAPALFDQPDSIAALGDLLWTSA